MAVRRMVPPGSGDPDALSRDDFLLVDSVGLGWFTRAYSHDYGLYRQKHSVPCNPEWVVLDPFHPGLMRHPRDVERQVAARQRALAQRNESPLRANAERESLYAAGTRIAKTTAAAWDSVERDDGHATAS